MNWIHRYRFATMIGLATTAAAVFGGATLAPAVAQDAYQSLANIVTCGTTAACVAGTNTSKGPGVQGVSTKGNGVVGQTKFNSTTSLRQSGVLGQDLSTSLWGFGVTGTSTSGGGVSGRSASNVGVLGQSTSSNGLFATSETSDGIHSITGVSGGASTGHAGVDGEDRSTSGSTNYGVIGFSPNGTGISGGSETGTAIAGSSVHGTGITGTSAGTGYGVIGRTTEGQGGVWADDTSGASFGLGLQATSTLGTGSRSTSELSDGAEGITGDSGGPSNAAAGVLGVDASGLGGTNFGVVAVSAHGVGLESSLGAANHKFAIEAFGGTSDNTGGSIAAFDFSGNRMLGVDNVGNVFINGLIYTQGFCASGCAKTHTGAGKRVVSYTPRETLPTMEDFGQAQLSNGSAYVSVDPAFSNVIDKASTYLVFITPEGDTRGLFVTNKSAQGFTVRENQHGQSSVSFSYRIVAKPYGSNERRLPMVETPTAVVPMEAARFKKPH